MFESRRSHHKINNLGRIKIFSYIQGRHRDALRVKTRYHSTHGLILIALVTSILIVSAQALYADSLTGAIEKFNDGDTFEIWGQSIRLKGIDAPENSQNCIDNTGVEYPCGDFATNFLRELVAGSEVTCQGTDKDKYDRLLAVCYINDGENLNKLMVESGWAVAFAKFDKSYAPQEVLAKKQKRGTWQGDFIRPAKFRESAWSNAKSSVKALGGDCLIKGNINSKGVRIYHTPWGSKHYKRTKISEGKGERWFCSEDEALAAGWRAPYR